MPFYPVIFDEDRVEYISDLITPQRVVKGVGGLIISGYFRRPALPVIFLHEARVYAWKVFPHAIRRRLLESQGSGAPSGSTPTSTISSKRPQGRASAEPGKHGGPRRESRRGGRAGRKECPKGHYWSYKKKKCVKSKFR